MTGTEGQARKHKFIIYWWAKTEEPKKFGHDEVELPQDELDEWEADDFLNEAAGGNVAPHRDYPRLPNFEAYYPLATFCYDFGVRKVVKAS